MHRKLMTSLVVAIVLLAAISTIAFAGSRPQPASSLVEGQQIVTMTLGPGMMSGNGMMSGTPMPGANGMAMSGGGCAMMGMAGMNGMSGMNGMNGMSGMGGMTGMNGTWVGCLCWLSYWRSWPGSYWASCGSFADQPRQGHRHSKESTFESERYSVIALAKQPEGSLISIGRRTYVC